MKTLISISLIFFFNLCLANENKTSDIQIEIRCQAYARTQTKDLPLNIAIVFKQTGAATTHTMKGDIEGLNPLEQGQIFSSYVPGELLIYRAYNEETDLEKIIQPKHKIKEPFKGVLMIDSYDDDQLMFRGTRLNEEHGFEFMYDSNVFRFMRIQNRVTNNNFHCEKPNVQPTATGQKLTATPVAEEELPEPSAID